MLYPILRRALFLLDAEHSHNLSLSALECLKNTPIHRSISKPAIQAPVNKMGLSFNNAVGLAAGLDKNGDYIQGLSQLGFGFLEMGTVTPKAQAGNPKPRLFRLTAEQAIINRMGFNNKGIDYLLERVNAAKRSCVLGINIGKNKVTPNEKALGDYLYCLDQAYKAADYITVNISSPNTPGLRELQNADELQVLISSLKTRQLELADKYKQYTPLTLKVAPDMTETQIDAISEILLKNNIDGVIVSNTTIERTGVENHLLAKETGGLSGKPLLDTANNALARFASNVKHDMTVIGVGGITSGNDAAHKIDLGADLVQIYTGFIYQGPQLIYDCAKQIA